MLSQLFPVGVVLLRIVEGSWDYHETMVDMDLMLFPQRSIYQWRMWVLSFDMFLFVYFDLAIVTQHELPFRELRQPLFMFWQLTTLLCLTKTSLFTRLARQEFYWRHTVDKKNIPSTCYLWSLWMFSISTGAGFLPSTVYMSSTKDLQTL